MYVPRLQYVTVKGVLAVRLDLCNPEVLWGYHASIVHVLEHSIGDLAIHFVTWILGAISRSSVRSHHTLLSYQCRIPACYYASSKQVGNRLARLSHLDCRNNVLVP